jgi:hypothetical protein
VWAGVACPAAAVNTSTGLVAVGWWGHCCAGDGTSRICQWLVLLLRQTFNFK